MPLHNFMMSHTFNHGANFLSVRTSDRQQGCRSALRPNARIIRSRSTVPVIAGLATPRSSLPPASIFRREPFRNPESGIKEERRPAFTAAPRVVGILSTRPRPGRPLAASPVESAANVLCSAQAGWLVTFAGFASLLAYHVWLNPFGNALSSDGTPRTSWVQEVCLTIHGPPTINAIMRNDNRYVARRRIRITSGLHIQISSASWKEFPVRMSVANNCSPSAAEGDAQPQPLGCKDNGGRKHRHDHARHSDTPERPHDGDILLFHCYRPHDSGGAFETPHGASAHALPAPSRVADAGGTDGGGVGGCMRTQGV